MQHPPTGSAPDRDGADPMIEPTDADDVDALVARLEARVAQRRAAGEYPADLETTLDAHWRNLAPPPDALAQERLDELDAAIAAARSAAGGSRRGFDPAPLVDALERMQTVVRALRDEVLRDRAGDA